MSNNKLTGDVIEQLSIYMVTAVQGEKAVDGITYALLLDNNKEDRSKIDEYTKLKQSIDNCGIDSDTVFQKLKVSNGYVFNLEVDVARKIMAIVSKKVYEWSKTHSDKTIDAGEDLFRDKPIKRRKEDIKALTKLLIKEYDAKGGKTAVDVEVALFSRNSTRKIICMVKDPKNKKVEAESKMIELDAFALRHRDIEAVNQLLLEKGYKLVNAKVGEILPSKTGVRFILGINKNR